MLALWEGDFSKISKRAAQSSQPLSLTRERKLEALQRWMKDQQLMGVDLSQLNHQELFTLSVLDNCLHITNKERVKISDAKFPEALKDATKLLIAALQAARGEQQALLSPVVF